MSQNSRLSPLYLAIGITALLITLLWQSHIIKNTWRYAKAFEYEWVAGSLWGGYGYSFDPATAWLGPYGDGTTYSLTAWVEPLYTFAIAIAVKIYGEYGRLVLTLLNVVWLGSSGILIFLLIGEIFDPKVGLYTTILFFILHACRPEIILYIGNAALAGFLYCLSAYLLLKNIKDPTISNSILLGTTIGIANLNHAGSLLLAPLCALIIVINLGIRKTTAWRTNLILITTTGLLLFPWVLRNYVVFGTFVPVRSGFGYNLYIGNPALARTFTPVLKVDGVSSLPLWTAENPYQSMQLLRDLKYDAALANYSIHVVSKNSSADYLSYNEVERDRVFLNRSLAFLRAEPLLSMKMMFWKMIAFLTFGKIRLGVVSIAAILGSLLFNKDNRVVSLAILVVGYMFPYILSLPIYYRYRTPIEPILFVLSGLFLGVCLQKATHVWKFFQGWIRLNGILRSH